MIMIRKLCSAAKPGIIRGNILTATAGFMLATHLQHVAINWLSLAVTLISLCLIIASACMYNNYFDRNIDALMERTKHRALPSKSLSATTVLITASMLVMGGSMLGLYGNALSLSITLFGFFIYVFVYTPIKRRSVYSTHIGALAGAVPPLVGYTAVTNNIDTTAALLFALLFAWQIPHFFSIATYRISDYTKANLPVLPNQKGIFRTKTEIAIYIAIFTCLMWALYNHAHINSYYTTAATLACALWFTAALYGFSQPRSKDVPWARKMFLLSLLVNVTVCITLILP